MKSFAEIKSRHNITVLDKNQCGFTLLEVLIATSILSIMMLLLFGSLRVCTRSWLSGEEHIKASSQMTIVQNFFRTYIESALVVDDNFNIKPLENPNDDEGYNVEENQVEPILADDPGFADREQVSFQGNEHEIQFVAVMPASAGRGGLQLFTISLFDGETQQLVVTITPFYPPLDDTQDITEEVSILDKVEYFAITYWGTKEFSYEPEWSSEWNEHHLPKMVRIEIELENQPAWPTIIVSPRLASLTEEGG